MPGGLWSKCKRCSEMVFTKDLLVHFNVCGKCGYHMPASVDERIQFTCDEGSFEELYTELMPVDRLDFKDKTTYGEKLEATRKKVGRNEAMTIGTGKIDGQDVILGVMNFKFLGGSMGVVVGEKVTIAIEMALDKGWPLILVCASGGARMHEGALSLMQMAKTCAALARLDEAGGVYISVLTDPTTGGVTASFATMADVILAEPESLIGFAGPRVIQNTIRQELPEGFQRAEFLLDRGQVDAIVPRDQMKARIAQLLKYLCPSKSRTERPAHLPESFMDKLGQPQTNGGPKRSKPPRDRLPPSADEEIAAADHADSPDPTDATQGEAVHTHDDAADTDNTESAAPNPSSSASSKKPDPTSDEKKAEKVKKKRKS